MSSVASIIALVVILGGFAGFAALFIFLLVRSASRYDKYGSVSGMLFEARVNWVFGEVPGRRKSWLLTDCFRVSGLDCDPPAIGLEYEHRGPTHFNKTPVRLELAQAEAVAGWLEYAAAGYGAPGPGDGWGFYEFTVFSGTRVEGLYGSAEAQIGSIRWRVHVVKLSDPMAPVGIGIRGTVTLSDKITGSSLTQADARTLAWLLRQAISAAAARPYAHAAS